MKILCSYKISIKLEPTNFSWASQRQQMQEHQNLQNKTKPTIFSSFTVAADARTPKSPKTGAHKFSPASQQQMHEQNLPKKGAPQFFLALHSSSRCKNIKISKRTEPTNYLQLHSSSRCKSIQISSLLLTNLHSATKFSYVLRLFFSEFATRSGNKVALPHFNLIELWKMWEPCISTRCSGKAFHNHSLTSFYYPNVAYWWECVLRQPCLIPTQQ